MTQSEKLPVADRCTWPGTEWEGDKLLACGEPTVGAGMFCDPIHKVCQYHSVCERHKKKLENWSEK